MTQQTTVDWPKLLDDLAWLYGDLDPTDPNQRLRVALGTPTLAERLLVSRGTLRRWLEEGAEPRHFDGEMLIERWVIATGKARQFLPRMALTTSVTRSRT
jgi:hypothetical protein